jgi:hypothetical protein
LASQIGDGPAIMIVGDALGEARAALAEVNAA